MPPEILEEALVAVQSGDLATVTRILDEYPHLPAEHGPNGVTLTLVALYHRQAAIADLLADAHPGPGWFESAALGLRDRVQDLLATKPERLDAQAGDGFTALHLAAYFGRADVARALIDAGADVSAISGNPAQLQPIHAAAASRSTAIVEMLLDAGADIGVQQASGHTALDAARQSGDADLEALLRRRGAT